jgi:hypothetical protein
MSNAGTSRLRRIVISVACLSIGIMTAATSAGALSKENGELPPISTDRTPQSAIDEEFAILRAHSIDITHVDRPGTGSCGNFDSAFLNPKCAKFHKRKLAHVRRVATYVPGGHAADE